MASDNCLKSDRHIISQNHILHQNTDEHALLVKAFSGLYPEKEINLEFSIVYSSKFHDYNANVRFTRSSLRFNLSSKWKNISEEIKIGLLQSLLNKVFKTKIKTQSIELYHIFLKNVDISAPKTKSDKYLETLFNMLNEKYFFGLLEKPNLKWHNSNNKVGTYEYGSDTISISRKLLDGRAELVEYVLYHEMLHKKLKFSEKSPHRQHTLEFKRLEKRFENYDAIKKELSGLANSKISVIKSFLWE